MNNDQRIIEELGKLKREIERLKRVEYPTGGGGGGVTDHGQLTGLGDDDHAQYLLITGNKTQNINGDKSFNSFPILPSANPSSLREAAHMQYVDTKVSLTGAQTIAGQKGFSSVPTIPHLGVTANNHVTSKYYVDQAILAAATPTYEWFDWTPTQTGWTALPTGTYRYFQVGKMCFFTIDITAGTSNSNLAVLSLPVAAKSGTYWSGVNGMAMDNGTVLSVATKWYIDASSGNISFGTDMGSGLWATSGTKRIRCEGFYEIA